MPMWTSTQYRQLVRGSAWYDLIVMAGFATPWSFAAVHGLLLSLSQAFNLPGELPPFEPMHMLMANLLGSIVCVWAVLRIRDPQQVYGRYDAVGRFLFSAWQLYALLHGGSSLLVIFLIFELAWGVVQVLPVRESSRAGSLPQGSAV
jgi:magnesium-transporting ATPase (P-type)